MLKEKVLEELRAFPGFMSGQKLADHLSVSRNAVWKAIKALEEEGYRIGSVKNLGYRLDQATKRLSRLEIAHRLGMEPDRLLVFEEIGSTNAYIKEHHEALPDGTVVLSARQSDGRGRLGRRFYSPEGGLYLSILFKGPFMPRPDYVTVAAAVAVSEVLENYGLSPAIKWVNDLMIDQRKAAGILTEGEVELEFGRMKYLVLGIGLNVNQDSFPREIEDIAISMKQAGGAPFDINQVASDLLSGVFTMIGHLSLSLKEDQYRNNAQDIIRRYNEKLYLKGQTVTLSGGSRPPVTGVLLGTDEMGHLMIQTNEMIISASYGEYRLNPQKGYLNHADDR